MKLKKIILSIILISIIISIVLLTFYSGNINKKTDTGKLKVVVTNFAAYDFVRQIAGDKVELTMIVSPGVEAHSYDPTAHDISLIQSSDLFIYIGGEVESWAEKVLESADTSEVKLLCLLDTVDLIKETEIEGIESKGEHHKHEEIEFDEHIWTSPANAIKMVNGIKNVIIEIDKKNEEIYKKNAEIYVSEIKSVQSKIQEIVDKKVRDRLIFADKMPMQYFINEYGLKVSAAFSGCSAETEPSSGTIAYLINKVKEEKIPVVLYIELSTGKIAKTISEETGCDMLRIETLHNVTKTDFENGETYVSLMTRNLEVLRKALQ